MKRLEKGYEILILILTGVMALFFVIQGFRTKDELITLLGIIGFFLVFPFLILYFMGLIFKKEEA